MNTLNFLTLEKVIDIHRSMISSHGGSHGIRDHALLESAISQPSMGDASGNFFHDDVFHMAAAYLYGIIKNHPFIDGNKRTALLCSIVFLEKKLWEEDLKQTDLYKLTLGVAMSKVSKEQVAKFFKEKYNVC